MKKIGHDEAMKLTEALRNAFSSRVGDGMVVSLGDVKNVTDYMGYNDMVTTNLLLRIIFKLNERIADLRRSIEANNLACTASSAKHAPYDSVSQPDHYKTHDKECIVEMFILFGLDNFIAFCQMNAWKYRYRAGNKANNSADHDNAKADRYIEYAARAREIDYWQLDPSKITDDEYWHQINDKTYRVK